MFGENTSIVKLIVYSGGWTIFDGEQYSQLPLIECISKLLLESNDTCQVKHRLFSAGDYEFRDATVYHFKRDTNIVAGETDRRIAKVIIHDDGWFVCGRRACARLQLHECIDLLLLESHSNCCVLHEWLVVDGKRLENATVHYFAIDARKQQ